MQRYRDLSGHSGVRAFEIGEDSIRVQFVDEETYEYTRAATGAEHIRCMQRLARSGSGLATYINQYVRDRYARKL